MDKICTLISEMSDGTYYHGYFTITMYDELYLPFTKQNKSLYSLFFDRHIILIDDMAKINNDKLI